MNEHCGTKRVLREQHHIGKSSGGWMFALHVELDDEFHSDWTTWELFIKERADTRTIKNEYGETFTFSELRKLVLERPMWQR